MVTPNSSENKLKKILKNILKYILGDKKGQGLVEYTFILSLVAIALVLAFNSLGLKLSDFFESVDLKISSIID